MTNFSIQSDFIHVCSSDFCKSHISQNYCSDPFTSLHSKFLRNSSYQLLCLLFPLLWQPGTRPILHQAWPYMTGCSLQLSWSFSVLHVFIEVEVLRDKDNYFKEQAI